MACWGGDDADLCDHERVAEIGGAVKVVESVGAIELEIADSADLVFARCEGGIDADGCGSVGGVGARRGSTIVDASGCSVRSVSFGVDADNDLVGTSRTAGDLREFISQADVEGSAAHDIDGGLRVGGSVDEDVADLEGRADALAVGARGFACASGGVSAATRSCAAIVGLVGGAGCTSSACCTAKSGGAVGDADGFVATTVGARRGVADALAVDTFLAGGTGGVGSTLTSTAIADVGFFGIAGDTGVSADTTGRKNRGSASALGVAASCGAGVGAASADLGLWIAGFAARTSDTSDAVFAAACVGSSALADTVDITAAIGARRGITNASSGITDVACCARDAGRSRCSTLCVGGGSDAGIVGTTTIGTRSGVTRTFACHATLPCSTQRSGGRFFVDGSIAVVVFSVAGFCGGQDIALASSPFPVGTASLSSCFTLAFSRSSGGSGITRACFVRLALTDRCIVGIGLAIAVIVQLVSADLFCAREDFVLAGTPCAAGVASLRPFFTDADARCSCGACVAVTGLAGVAAASGLILCVGFAVAVVVDLIAAKLGGSGQDLSLAS